MNNLYQNKYFRKGIFILTDIGIVILSSLIALSIRFDMNHIPRYFLDNAVYSFWFYILATYIVMRIFKLYDRVWTYASISEFNSILKSTLLLEVLFLIYHVLTKRMMPRSYYILQFFVMLILFIASRFFKMAILSIKNKGYGKSKKKIMIVGAGNAASLLIREINNNLTGDSKIVCAIDDNINKKGKYILGVPILGDRNYIKEAVKKYNIEEIIIAAPSANSDDIKELVDISNKSCKLVKILPYMSKVLNDSLLGSVRRINYEDLLGRDPININEENLGNFIEGKTIMVSGGGGSIGSELCRQIISYKPKKLIIFDIYENNAYSIQMELENKYPYAHISTLIGSVRDYDRLEWIFNKYRPDVIYHAAAHKHVPLMEKSPNEAIKNNCLGTLNMVKLADKYKVHNFVLISTDKAVRPTNVMGATKRICEMIMQTYAKKSKNTVYSAVRFGNVLGSNGSVIPLFLKQIENGGPVTVTHKDIRRFFMTIPEAVSLVLQAGLYAKGGEIFVLDMGKPVKIYDLAYRLIKLKGFEPNRDIDIEITGLRPGEKLYEEILMDEEGLKKTDNNLIFIGKPIEIDEEEFLKNLDELIKESMKNGKKIKECTERVCSTYKITDNE